MLLALVPIGIAESRLDDADRVFGERPTPIRVMQPQTANSVTLTLESVLTAATGTEVAFTLELPDWAAASSVPQILGPISPGEDLRFSGFGPRADGVFLRLKPHVAGEAVQQFVLFLGPITNLTQPPSITFTRLRLQGDGQSEPTMITGPWTFALTREVLEVDQVLGSHDIGAQITHDGITVAVDRIESRSSGLYLQFAVSSQRPEPIIPVDPAPRLVFEDGSSARPVAVGPVDQTSSTIGSGQTTHFLATFNPVRIRSAVARLEFGPFVTSNAAPSSIVIRNPFGAWSADPVTIGGEQFRVADVTYRPDDHALAIAVTNQEPVASASVLFLGVDAADSVVARDENGQEYHYSTASTGMRRQSDAALGAGRSTFEFTGIEPSVQQLTLTVDHSSIVVRGPWAVQFTLP